MEEVAHSSTKGGEQDHCNIILTHVQSPVRGPTGGGHKTCIIYCFLGDSRIATSTASWKREEGSRSSVGDPFAETVGRFRGMDERIRNHRRSNALASIFVSLAICWRRIYGGLLTGYNSKRICRSYLYLLCAEGRKYEWGSSG